ncbi:MULTISPECIES: MarR family winged helix-turn-helix transcriptional regulator [unclassified Chamaesiphon]|uniref:MarR family winged helix-turn-helix transcriptional regulator n=1 Tax=unclassified Chamaesiphon TaxID=2620921 RepID=UPI00286D3F78|nr:MULTISPECIES: MarR family winged helix-turn-helix transcriptional regulator [unclassified Chamaesiphon]
MADRIPQSQLTGVSQVPATCMGMHVRRASRIITQVYDAALRPVGLVLSQFTLLVCISMMESAPITHLAQELYTDQTTLTRNLKPLKQRGLVAIDPGEDRRVKLVSLTVEGRSILAQALPLWEQAQAQVMQHFVGVASQNENRQQWQTLLSLLSDLKNLS